MNVQMISGFLYLLPAKSVTLREVLKIPFSH